MLLDLTWALLAAFLVGVLPGYYWARCLFAASDAVAQVTYGIGLSMALVPAVALIPARLLGQGVTLSATVVSALLVFGTGVIAYYGLGPEKAPARPVAQPARAPGLIVLLPIAGALSLVASANAGFVEADWAVFPTAGLVVFAGVLYLFGSGPVESLPASVEPEASRGESGPGLRYLLLGVVLLLVVGRGYAGPVLQD